MEDEPKRKWEYLHMGLDPDDMDLLVKAARAEKLNKTDIIRRAIRAYAKSLLSQQQDAQQSKVA